MNKMPKGMPPKKMPKKEMAGHSKDCPVMKVLKKGKA